MTDNQMEEWKIDLSKVMAERSKASPELMMLIQMQQQMFEQMKMQTEALQKLWSKDWEDISSEDKNYIADATNLLEQARSVDLYRVEYNGSWDNATYKWTPMEKFFSKNSAIEYWQNKYGKENENKTWRINTVRTIITDKEYNDLINK